MAEQFAKNRLSSYAVIPVLVLSMGVAIGILGSLSWPSAGSPSCSACTPTR